MPFFLITLIVTIAVAVLPYLHVQLPPAVTNLLPWKWGIIALLNAILLLFLGLQLLFNFGLESTVKEAARLAAGADKAKKVEELNTTERKMFEADNGKYTDSLHRTIWLKLAFVLHILATAAAALMYWMEKRGTNQVQLEAGVRW